MLQAVGVWGRKEWGPTWSCIVAGAEDGTKPSRQPSWRSKRANSPRGIFLLTKARQKAWQRPLDQAELWRGLKVPATAGGFEGENRGAFLLRNCATTCPLLLTHCRLLVVLTICRAPRGPPQSTASLARSQYQPDPLRAMMLLLKVEFQVRKNPVWLQHDHFRKDTQPWCFSSCQKMQQHLPAPLCCLSKPAGAVLFSSSISFPAALYHLTSFLSTSNSFRSEGMQAAPGCVPTHTHSARPPAQHWGRRSSSVGVKLFSSSYPSLSLPYFPMK